MGVSWREFGVRVRGFLHVHRGIGHADGVGKSNVRNRCDLARGDRDLVLDVVVWLMVIRGGDKPELGGYIKRESCGRLGISFVNWVD